MKKLVLGLLLLVNSVFAVSLSEIGSDYPRAFITQVDIRDSRDNLDPKPLLFTKLNTITYQYWTAGYPYQNLKYSGKITNWWYTYDYTGFSDNYETWYDQYINPNDLTVTYIYIDYAGYATNKVKIYKYENGSRGRIYPEYQESFGSIRVYKIEDSQNIGSFFIETFIQATDGTAQLGNDVTISRNTK